MISVVIPTYKRPDLLKRLLASIAQQTLLPDEVIVVDDCSMISEEYHAVIESFQPLFKELHFHSLEQNSGAPVARNTGIQMAKGEWIALVDDDDEWLPHKLEKQWQLILNSKARNLGLVYTWTKAVGVNGQESYDSRISVKGDAKSALLTTNFIMSASVMVKKDAIVKSGLFDEEMPSCQDWEMWTRIAINGYTVDVVEDVLTLYHRHGGESIGLGHKAKKGYYLFLMKYWKPILMHTSPLNILKKLYLYLKVKSARNL
jgi:glycosyltransferase involved in cell wall biosynthesis